MKKLYESPLAEIEKFTVAEKITTSWDIHGDETLDDTELREF